MWRNYLTDASFQPSMVGDSQRARRINQDWTADEHRHEARRLLAEDRDGNSPGNLAAAQVHATLALSLAVRDASNGGA